MSWVKPGDNFAITVDEQVVHLKGLHVKDRQALIHEVQDVDESEKGLDALYDIVARYVVSINGYEGDIKELLAYQSKDHILEIFQAILEGSSLTDQQSKNSGSSSGPSLRE